MYWLLERFRMCKSSSMDLPWDLLHVQMICGGKGMVCGDNVGMYGQRTILEPPVTTIPGLTGSRYTPFSNNMSLGRRQKISLISAAV
jgi:hypothetical protein